MAATQASVAAQLGPTLPLQVSGRGQCLGEIIAFDAGAGVGEIAGDDLARYTFAAADVRSPSALGVGVRVDFTATDDRRATAIAALAASPSAPSSPSASGNFDFGRVIQRTFSSIGKNWVIFFGGAAVMVGVPSLIMSWGQGNMPVAINGALPFTAFAMPLAIGGLLLLLGYYLLQAMVLKAAINGFNGKPTSFASAFRTGLGRALPLIGLAILMGLGIGLGFILLIVPGVFLAVLWSVAAPVLVAERKGVIESFSRSADLTKGYRWSVFGLIVVYLVLTWIVSAVGAVLGLATGGLTPAGPNVPAMMITNSLVNVLSAVVGSAGAASLYYELRTAKEGAGAEELASVFD